jgi:hypothetical protein
LNEKLLKKRRSEMIAYVKYPNTPESDAMDKVWHVVETPDGKVEVMATDPMDAIDQVRKREIAK